MSLTKSILKKAMPLPKLTGFERYLFIGPHPDDIEIGAGASVAALRKAGKEIAFLICTDGRYGTENLDQGLSCDALAGLRRQESLASAAVLDVADVRFLDLSDGGFYEDEALLRGIAEAVSDFQPDVIFAPDPAPTNEVHPDHLHVGRAAGQIACFAYNRGIMEQYGCSPAPVKAIAYYMTAKPTGFLATTGLIRKQIGAIACHKSQFPEGSAALKDVETYLRLRAFENGLRSHHGTAEGFRVLGSAQMHVLAEFGE
ncbi:MAG: PIG-L family deacetylase [Lachnospiraceae bacterium]|nr:PIG-L family deacetylase [Lachnospiraceae bacterium]